MTQNSLPFLFGFCLVVLPLAVANAAPPAAHANQPKPGLARVSIVEYSDNTGTRNFGYMPNSLTEAIDKSLQLRFEYLRESPAKTEIAMKNFRATTRELNAETAAAFCKQNGTDILIFGSFAYDPGSRNLTVKTSISLGAADRFRVLPERHNPVNATIFRLADHVADDIVQALTEIAREQAAAGENQKAVQGEKIELKKIKDTTWKDTNWNIAPGFGVTIPLNSSFSGYRNLSPMPNLLAERRLLNKIYVGVMGSFLEVKASNLGLETVQAAGLLAYHLHLMNRWDIYVMAGAGYYYGKYYNNSSCSGNCTATSESFSIQNPYFVARAGVNFLILRWLSAGLFGQADMFYDRATPLNYGGGGMQVGVHF